MGGMGFGKKYAPSNSEALDTEMFRGIYDTLLQFDADNPDFNDYPSHDLMLHFLNPAVIRQYFAWFLSGDLKDELNNYKEAFNPTLPKTLRDFKLVGKYRTAATSIPIKEKGTHPLTRDEYLKAAKYLEKNPQLQSVFYIFDAGMLGYLESLNNFILSQNNLRAEEVKYSKEEVTTSLYKKLRNLSTALQAGVLSKGITQELMPLIAHKILQSEVDAPEKPAQKGLQEGLTFRSAFKSLSDDNIIVTCPFKTVIGHIFNTEFIISDDNKCTAINLNRPAGLLRSIIRRLENQQNYPHQAKPNSPN